MSGNVGKENEIELKDIGKSRIASEQFDHHPCGVHMARSVLIDEILNCPNRSAREYAEKQKKECEPHDRGLASNDLVISSLDHKHIWRSGNPSIQSSIA